MHVKENNLITPEARSFFRTVRKEEELDETMFDIWKNELQNNLPGFWESMNHARRR